MTGGEGCRPGLPGRGARCPPPSCGSAATSAWPTTPALLTAQEGAAQEGAERVLPLFVLDDALRGPSGDRRLAVLYRSLRALDAATGHRLVVRHGDPARVVPAVAQEVGASQVHVSADCAPYGRRRDRAVAEALAADGRELVRTGSPYARGPGTVRKDDGTPYRVFTPFYRVWRSGGLPRPAQRPAHVRWAHGGGGRRRAGGPRRRGRRAARRGRGGGAGGLGALPATSGWPPTPTPGTAPTSRGRPASRSTSSTAPSTPARCWRTWAPPSSWTDGAEALARELCFRDFYADVLWHEPRSAREPLDERVGGIRWDTGATARERLAAWKAGRTGFPVVDAGMRQLDGEAWVHNRVRMIVASFLVKDLHVDWREGGPLVHAAAVRRGPREQPARLAVGGRHGDGRVAFFRVFNPVLQGEKFDPQGDYVRRWVPELRDVAGKRAHQPWTPAGRGARRVPRARRGPQGGARRGARPLRGGEGVTGTSMVDGGAATFVPAGASLEGLADAAAGCAGCSLSALENRTVFGEGPAAARLVLVGEQPGDVEDQRGRPFVGPAGRLLDRAMAEAGLDRSSAYVTNAVKHFSFTYRGKRRIHSTPGRRRRPACGAVAVRRAGAAGPGGRRPAGATAGKALLGPSFRVTKSRGVLLPRDAAPGGPAAQDEDDQASLFGGDDEPARGQSFWLPTVHPSAVLRADDDARDAAFGAWWRTCASPRRSWRADRGRPGPTSGGRGAHRPQLVGAGAAGDDGAGGVRQLGLERERGLPDRPPPRSAG